MITRSAAVSALIAQQAQRRRAIDENDVVAAAHRLEQPQQRLLSCDLSETSWISAADRSMLLGKMSSPGTLVWPINCIDQRCPAPSAGCRCLPAGCGFTPRPTDSEPCGSKSTSSTCRPSSASAAPRLIVVVVFANAALLVAHRDDQRRPVLTQRRRCR
mgnify:CR=1 FL=1